MRAGSKALHYVGTAAEGDERRTIDYDYETKSCSTNTIKMGTISLGTCGYIWKIDA